MSYKRPYITHRITERQMHEATVTAGLTILRITAKFMPPKTVFGLSSGISVVVLLLVGFLNYSLSSGLPPTAVQTKHISPIHLKPPTPWTQVNVEVTFPFPFSILYPSLHSNDIFEPTKKQTVK